MWLETIVSLCDNLLKLYLSKTSNMLYKKMLVDQRGNLCSYLFIPKQPKEANWCSKEKTNKYDMRKLFLAPCVQVEFTYRTISPVLLWPLPCFYTQSCPVFPNFDTWKVAVWMGQSDHKFPTVISVRNFRFYSGLGS